MRTTHVWCAGNLYRMRVGAGVLGLVGEELSRLGFAGRVVVITDQSVNALFGETVDGSLRKAGLEPSFVVIPPGEDQKSLESAGHIYGRLNDFAAERGTPLLSLGGGVIGDLTGFIAATYFRGLPLVHLPTTLLAQVDSSIGGKVAVNHGRLKNNIGAFHQPLAVLSDTSVLASLPEREFRNGMAEVIKSAVIRDAGLFGYLEAHLWNVMQRDAHVMERIVSVTAEIKSAVVQEDERDSGLRNILNFGHTVGHGVETASDFSLSHGEAVSIGMVAACRIAVSMGMLDTQEMERLRSLLVRVGLPVAVPANIDADTVFSAMTRDKKVSGGRIRFVLPTRLGEVAIRSDVPVTLIEETLHSSYAVA
ncbi:MAG: 3-dehydroquinate synthase [Chloroflexota bacterium]